MYSDVISGIIERAMHRKLVSDDLDYLRWDQERINSLINNMTNLELINELSYAISEAVNDMRIG